jgi:hypothetical protein
MGVIFSMASLAGIGMVHGSCNDFVVESEYQMQADSSKDSSKGLASWVLKEKLKSQRYRVRNSFLTKSRMQV